MKMAPQGISPPRFQVGQDVLARWNDGLFYLGTILKVDEKAERCYMRFEDDSEYWALFKDIQKGPSNPTDVDSEICCCLCLGENSDKPNEIVLCDYCGLPYHQLCHNPLIGPEVLKLDVKWSCRPCVFAKNTKKGGAVRKGPNARELLAMKQSLPYDLNSLEWDPHHKRNSQQCYCYCGGPGDWYMKMLQCCRCQQWFHEACMQCLEKPLLFGDRNYVFVCACCNKGPEYLQRIDLHWVDLVHLVLFNLTLQHNVKYYDLEGTIMPWIHNNWDRFNLKKLLGASRAVREERVLHTLETCTKLFKSGKESKKRFTLWGLRVRLPPPGPTIVIPSEGPVTDESMKNLNARGRKTITFTPIESGHVRKDNTVTEADISQSPLPTKFHKRRASTDEDEAIYRKAKKARRALLDSYAGKKRTSSGTEKPVKKPKVNGFNNQTHKGYSGNPKYYTLNGYGKKVDEDCLKPATLDTFIPWPNNYEGHNHPFKTDLEKIQELECSRMKERLLSSYQGAITVGEIDSDSLAETTDTESLSTLTDLSDAQSVPSQMQPARKKRGRKSKAELQRIAAIAALSEEQDGVVNPKITLNHSMENGHQSIRYDPLATHTPNVLDKATLDGLSQREVPLKQLKWSVSSYFGAADRLAHGERFHVLGRRVMTSDSTVQYLIQWEGAFG